MKIAIVCKKFSLKFGGLERYSVNLTRELVRSGHDVHVFSNIFDEEQGIIFHQVPMLRFSSPGKNLSFAYFAGHALSKMEFDIIHSMERIFYQDIFRVSDGINPVQLLQRYPNPLIRKIKAAGPRRLVLGYLEKKIFQERGCKCVMTNSDLVKNQIINHYQVDPKKIHVIYNGVDTLRFHLGVRPKHRAAARKKFGIEEAELALLFVSNDFKLKRLKTILCAMTLLKNNRIKLIVAGKDNEKPYLKWAAENGLGKRVLFIGPQKEIEKIYAAADVLVLPTLYDAFANVCLEAMACGIPVITTCTNGAAWVIEDGKQGYILKTQAPDELKGRIETLVSPIKRSEMGAWAAARAGDFTMEKHIREVLDLYEKVRHQSDL
ncbi:MAG: glycosyltransferase family 4 protein [Deltaproteobacteria bacterium]|nr:glycosyltransferase family 4 protein [Deltaproteobacteria bacterium]MBW2010639.1 glycosyltransferase family 4 protein [Deltaproteobacteria bacterium]